MATDPICGMFVAEREGSLSLVREGRTYYFCSAGCLHEFAEPEAARRRLRYRLAVAWPLAVAVVVLTDGLRVPAAVEVGAGCAALVQVYAGGPFYLGLRDAVRDRTWNMDVLVAVGTSVAFLYSLAAVLDPRGFPPPYFFDASSLIVALLLTGRYLEQLTRARASAAVLRLGELLPPSAAVVRDGAERRVALEEVRPGDRLRIRPGERVPADAVVRLGRSSVDETLLTGEPTPVVRGPGDRVIAGSLNLDGLLEAEAVAVGEATFVAQVGRLVTESEMARVPLQRTADRIAARFVPFVLAVALGAAAAWYLAGGAPAPIALLVFVSVAITACPCAFGIATPAAILVGTGRAAESGVLFRGEESIERASRVDTVMLDKTGTLTRGRPTLVEVRAAPGISEDELLRLAAAAETGAAHPLARAVVEAARARHLPLGTPDDVRVRPGAGLDATVEGRSVAVRRAAAGDPADARTRSEVFVDGRRAGELAFEDPVAAGAAEAVAALRRRGLRVVLATGDAPGPAERVGEAVGVEERRAGLAPADKVAWIAELRAAGRTVAFVGDGLNDAPALAAADLGIAIGTGTEVAQEAGQVLLVRPDPRGVPRALDLARATVRKVRGNLRWAIGYNVVLLPIAAGALVPWLGLGIYRVLPIAGAAAMGVSSATVILNSLALVRRGSDEAPRGATGPAGRSRAAT